MSTLTAPRISVNQLATYLVSTPFQRKRIIQAAKTPPPFMVNWYDMARQPINQFVAGGMSDESILVNESIRLSRQVPNNDYEETRLRTNLEAIDAFLDCYDQIDLAEHSFRLGPNSAQPLIVDDVEISIRPEFLAMGGRRGQKVCGGIKFYFAKNDPLTDQSAPYITALLMQHIRDHHQPEGYTARNESCIVVDIFAGRAYAAPRAITKRFQDIKAACQEITLWWSEL
jgi:hypothetical protein